MVKMDEFIIKTPSETQYLNGLQAGVPVSVKFHVQIFDESIVQILKSCGISSVCDTSEAASALNVAVVREGNVELPFMAPETAKRLAERLDDAFQAAGIKIQSYYWPVTMEQMCRPGDMGKKLKHINPERHGEIMRNRGADFVEQMRAEARANAQSISEIDVAPVGSQNRSLWRGGYLGGQAHAVATPDYAKSCCYASSKLHIATGYAGNEGGFVYEYEVLPGQKFTDDWGLENAHSQSFEMKYETAVFPKNRLKNIYLPVEGGLFRIPLEDERWQDFLELYTPTEELSPAHTIRRNAQLDNPAAVTHYDFIKGKIVEEVPPYRAADLKAVYGDKVAIGADGKVTIDGDVDLRGIRIQDMDNLHVTGRLALSQIGDVLPEAGSLDLRDCRNVDLTGKDLSCYAQVLFPDDTKELNGILRFPKQVDLNDYYDIDLSGMDLSSCERLTPPATVTDLKTVKLPDSLDLDGCYRVELSGMDFSDLSYVKFPQNTAGLSNIRLPRNGVVDLSSSQSVEFSSDMDLPADFSRVKLPKEVCFASDLSGAQNLDLSGCEKVTLTGLSGERLPPETSKVVWAQNMEWYNCNFSDVTGMDLSGCDSLEISGRVHLPHDTHLKWPKHVEFQNFCWVFGTPDLDFSGCADVKIGLNAQFGMELERVKWSKRVEVVRNEEVLKRLDVKKIDTLSCTAFGSLTQIDLSGVNNLDLSGSPRLCIHEDVKLPSGSGHIKWPEHLFFDAYDLATIPHLDLGGCKAVELYRSIFPADTRQITWPKVVRLHNCDFSQVTDLDFVGCDSLLLRGKQKFPTEIRTIQWPRHVDLGCDLSDIDSLDFSSCKNINLFSDVKFPEDLSKIKWPERVNLQGCNLSQVKNVDFSACHTLTISYDTYCPDDLSKIKWPENGSVAFQSNTLKLDGADFSRCSSVDFSSYMQFPKDLSTIKWPKNINFSKYSSLDFTNVDFSHCESVILPNDLTPEKLRGVQWPTAGVVHFQDCAQLDGMDLSTCPNAKFLNVTTAPKDFKWPKNIDFSSCFDFRNLSECDFGHCERVVFSAYTYGLSNVILPKNGVADFSACNHIDFYAAQFPDDLSKIKWPDSVLLYTCDNLKGADFSTCDEVIIRYGNIKDLKGVRLPQSIDLGELTQIDLSGTDFSHCRQVVFPSTVVDLKDITLPTSGVMDFGHCKEVIFSDNIKSLKNMVLPKTGGVDFSACSHVKFSQDVPLPMDLSRVKWPQSADFSAYGNLDFNQIDMTGFRKVVLPEGTDISFMQRARCKLKGVQIEYAPATEVVAEAVEETAEKAGAKTVTHTAVNAATDGAAKKSGGVLGALAKANAAYDKGFDSVIDRMSNALNNSAVGRMYDKAATAVSNSKVGRAVGKAVDAVAQTRPIQALKKGVSKTLGTAVGKSALKKIPVVSLGAGCYFAYDRFKKGEWVAGCAEVASGAFGCLPGLGTAASTAIDVGLVANDMTGTNPDAETPEPALATETPTPAPTPTVVPTLPETIDVTALEVSLEPIDKKLAQSGQNITKEGEQKTDDKLINSVAHSRNK